MIRLIAENKKNLHNEERILLILLSNFRVFVRCLPTVALPKKLGTKPPTCLSEPTNQNGGELLSWRMSTYA